MTTTTTNYTVRRYSDNQAIGSVDLTREQFRRYESMSQQGLVKIGDLPHDLYNLDEQYRDASPDTTVYLEITGEMAYVVCDAGGDYIRDVEADQRRDHRNSRTPASDEAQEFETREEAQAACRRATDRVIARTQD